MKKTLYLLTISTFIIFVACEKDEPDVFNSADGIYFSSSSNDISYTFAKYPTRTVDTLRFPVTVMGKPSDKDRELELVSLDSSDATAIEGTHFKLLPPYKLPANQVSTTVPVVIYRTEDLDSLSVSFRLGLKANANFQSGISSKTTIKVTTGYIQKPPTWGERGGTQWAGYTTNLGTWTKTKYIVVLKALYDPAADTTITEFPYSRFGPPAISIQHLQMVKNYIITNYPGNYTGVGAKLLDPDANNLPVQVGPSNY